MTEKFYVFKIDYLDEPFVMDKQVFDTDEQVKTWLSENFKDEKDVREQVTIIRGTKIEPFIVNTKTIASFGLTQNINQEFDQRGF